MREPKETFAPAARIFRFRQPDFLYGGGRVSLLTYPGGARTQTAGNLSAYRWYFSSSAACREKRAVLLDAVALIALLITLMDPSASESVRWL